MPEAGLLQRPRSDPHVEGPACEHGDGRLSYNIDMSAATERPVPAEQALRDAIQRYQAVVNALGDGVLVIDRTGEILEANASAARIFGRTLAGNIFSPGPGWRVRNEEGREVSPHDFPATRTLLTGTA